jgi:hypothetical protein
VYKEFPELFKALSTIMDLERGGVEGSEAVNHVFLKQLPKTASERKYFAADESVRLLVKLVQSFIDERQELSTTFAQRVFTFFLYTGDSDYLMEKFGSEIMESKDMFGALRDLLFQPPVYLFDKNKMWTKMLGDIKTSYIAEAVVRPSAVGNYNNNPLVWLFYPCEKFPTIQSYAKTQADPASFLENCYHTSLGLFEVDKQDLLEIEQIVKRSYPVWNIISKISQNAKIKNIDTLSFCTNFLSPDRGDTFSVVPDFMKNLDSTESFRLVLHHFGPFILQMSIPNLFDHWPLEREETAQKLVPWLSQSTLRYGSCPTFEYMNKNYGLAETLKYLAAGPVAERL